MSYTPAPRSDSRSGIALILLAASLWGTVGLVVKQIYDCSEIPALGAGFFRLAFGLPFALLGCWLMRGSKTMRVSAPDLAMMVLVGLLMATYLTLYFQALERVGVTVATLIALCTAPVITALLSILVFGDRLSLGFVLSLAMSLGGTILLIHRPGLDLGSQELIKGSLLSLAAALAYSLMVFASKRIPDRFPSLLPSTIMFGAGGLALLPLALSQGALSGLNRPSLAWFLYLGAVPTALGYGLFFLGVRGVRPQTTAVLTLAEPLAAALLARLLLGERLGPAGSVGAALLLGGVAILFSRGRSKTPAKGRRGRLSKPGPDGLSWPMRSNSNQEVEMKQPFVLVHGAWHGGWCWDGVARGLKAAGHQALTPTLPGHNPGDDRSGIVFDNYVSGIAEAVNSLPGGVVLVGHSSAGFMLQAAAPKCADRLSRLVFHNAFVLGDGQSQFDLVPPEVAQGMTAAAQASPDNCVPVLEEFVRESLMAGDSKETQDALISRLNPQPLALFTTKVKTGEFQSLSTPRTVLFCKDDASLPPGAYLGMAQSLGEFDLVELEGGHETLFTDPDKIVQALLKIAG